jgi:hypothetical protein
LLLIVSSIRCVVVVLKNCDVEGDRYKRPVTCGNYIFIASKMAAFTFVALRTAEK